MIVEYMLDDVNTSYNDDTCDTCDTCDTIGVSLCDRSGVFIYIL